MITHCYIPTYAVFLHYLSFILNAELVSYIVQSKSMYAPCIVQSTNIYTLFLHTYFSIPTSIPRYRFEEPPT